MDLHLTTNYVLLTTNYPYVPHPIHQRYAGRDAARRVADAFADHRLHDSRRGYFHRRIPLSRTFRLHFHHGPLAFLAGLTDRGAHEYGTTALDPKPGAGVHRLLDDHGPIAFQDLLRTTFYQLLIIHHEADTRRRAPVVRHTHLLRIRRCRRA